MTDTQAQPEIRRIFEQWHDFARTGDVEGLMGLYADNATVETPLVKAIRDDASSGTLTGAEEIRGFFEEGTRRRPNQLVGWYRDGTFLTDGRLLFWEYRRETPDGEQVDLAEVMEIERGRITRHRIYWGWFGVEMLIANRLARQG